MRISLVCLFRERIPAVARRLRSRISSRIVAAFRAEKNGQPMPGGVQKGPARVRFASYFPCLFNKEHKHAPGSPHTCNDFLIRPRRRSSVRRARHKASALPLLAMKGGAG